MIRVRDVARIIEQAAPTARALPDDNPGLQAGDPSAPVRGILVALDPSPAAVGRARSAGASLLVTHHPLFYERPRRIDTATPQGAAAGAALAAGIAVYAAHTNLDAAPQGLGAEAARLLGLGKVRFLHPAPADPPFKLVVFAPARSAARLHRSLAAAGAGVVGRYDHCAFFSPGEGLFRPLRGARPAIGRPGRMERVSEVRLEMLVEAPALAPVLTALRAAHPYEEPAFDLYPLRPPDTGGLGCVGDIAPVSFAALSRHAAGAFRASVRTSGRAPARVRRVAVVPGSGGSLVAAAARAGAQALVTGEVRYHDMRDAEHYGLGIVELGHDRSEMPSVGLLARIIREGLREAGRAVPVHTFREPPAARPRAVKK